MTLLYVNRLTFQCSMIPHTVGFLMAALMRILRGGACHGRVALAAEAN